MPRKIKLLTSSAAIESPEYLSLPKRVDRKTGAKLVTDRFFPVSHRSLEAWPLTWRHVNGKALVK